MEINVRLKIENEAKWAIIEKLTAQGWIESLIIAAVEEEVPYKAQHSPEWQGIEEHAKRAAQRATNALMCEMGNLCYEIGEKTRKKAALKNLVRDMPEAIRGRLMDRINLIEQGKSIEGDR